ncbi:MAG: hypothetical protein DRH04_09510 [Deltaproteobacteria bacterium]|nr:MAG: hypothetical protein DRH04_09510 [Deltaproteobacteria bacterium]
MKKKALGIISAIVIPVITALIIQLLLEIDVIGYILKTIRSILAVVSKSVSIPVWIILFIILAIVIVWYLRLSHNQVVLEKPWKSWMQNTKEAKRKYPPIDTMLQSKEIPDNVRLDLLGFQNDGEIIAYKKGLCHQGYEPGTFTISEISPGAEFIKPETTFDFWVTNVLSEELELIETRFPSLLKGKATNDVKAIVKKILDLRTSVGKTLRHEIWFQEYSDIFRRIVLFVVQKNPDYELELYPNLTVKRKALTLDVLRWIDENKKPSLHDWLSVSIAAGLMGVNEKSIHAATSDIKRAYTIPLDSESDNASQAVQRIAKALWKTSQTSSRIDATNVFFHSLKSSAGRRFKILSFPDDYIETIFLLNFYDKLLEEYPHVEIDCVPRSIRCGNDATYGDVKELSINFHCLKNSARFRIHDKGPKLGTVNLLKLHYSVMNLLENSDIVDARGARNYEMMQGINKDAYFGFMVCRDFSESVTGLFAEDIPLVFIHQPAKEKSFRGFRNRHKRIDKGQMICEITALDNKDKWEGGCLSQINQWSSERRNRFEVTQSFYSKNAPGFHGKYGDYLETEVLEYLDNMQGRILVVGCGSGKEVNYLASRGCDVYGIDLSDEAIHLAKNLYPDLWDRFFVEDMYNLHIFKEGQFDGIVANAVFVHLLDREDLSVAVEKMKQRLAPGGLGYIRVIDKDEKVEEYDGILFGSTRWFVYYEMDELEAICQNLSLTIIRKDRIQHARYSNVAWLSVLFQQSGNAPNPALI